MRVGLFDSGVGGLTVLKAIKDKYPRNDYIYYGDTLNSPYGDKSIDNLKKYADRAINFLLKKKVDIIIIACGTISSNCLSYLQDKYELKILDIVSPTINYLNNSNYQNIGVIATCKTIESHIFKRIKNKQVIEMATPELVPLIENNMLDNVSNILNKYLRPYGDILDVLVLGCTHYPIIEFYIRKCLPNTEIINMADYLELKNDGNSKLDIYFTKLNGVILDNINNILNNDKVSVKLVKKY